MGLSAAQILAVSDRKIQRVEVPEWGDGAHVYVRSLSIAEALAANKEMESLEGADVIAAQLAQFLGDENGQRLFADTASAAAALNGKAPAVVLRLLNAGQALNGSGSIEDAKQKS